MNKIDKLNQIQKEAEAAHLTCNKRSTVALSVGLGKSKLAINRIKTYSEDSNIVFSGAREIYLDGFKSEMIKFGMEDRIDKLHFCCTPSLKNYKHKCDLFIYDESHLSSEMAWHFMHDQLSLNPNIEILCLTGTPGTQLTNALLTYCPISYEKLTDESITEGMLNDYEVVIVKHDLLEQFGSYKAKSYVTSELKQYKWLENKYKTRSYNTKSKIPFEVVMMKKFFSHLKSKEIITKQLLGTLSDSKVLIYCGSIAQTSDLPYPSYHSDMDTEQRKNNFLSFLNGEINILTNVNGIRESVNVPNLKYGIIMKVDASKNGFEQCKGRFHRLSMGEMSTIYVLVANNTIEEEWIKKATMNIDQSKIREIIL